MPCISPIRLPNPLYNNKDPAALERRISKTKNSLKYVQDSLRGISRFIDVPCGKCYGCMRMRCNGWVFRHLLELSVTTSAHFVTLTYNNDNLRFTSTGEMCFSKPDVQKFLKRLRKWLSVHYPDVRIKYHIAAEYGDTFGRPHYHMLLYGYPHNPDALDHIPVAWSLGQVDIGTVTEASVRYVVDYITQYYYGDAWSDPLQVPFALYSNGLGSDMYSTIASYLKHNHKPLYPLNGKTYKIPNSYLNALNEHGFISNSLYFLIKYNSQKYYEDNKLCSKNSGGSDGCTSYRSEISHTREKIISHRRKYELRKQGLKS